MTLHHVVVAGATGYLGHHLVTALSRTPNTIVTALSRKPRHADFVIADNVEYSELDVRSEASATEFFSRVAPTHVINASSYGVQPNQTGFKESVEVNTWGTYVLLTSATRAGVKRFVQIGSYFEYASQSADIVEDSALGANSVYASTKSAASLLLNDRRLCGDMEAVVARAFHLWGDQEPAHRLTSEVIKACASGTPLDLTPGLQKKDFTYVQDAADWIGALTLQTKPLAHNVYNIAGGRRCTVRDFVMDLATYLNGKELMHFGTKPMPAREPPSGLACTSRLTSELGSLGVTPFKEALQRTIKTAEVL